MLQQAHKDRGVLLPGSAFVPGQAVQELSENQSVKKNNQINYRFRRSITRALYCGAVTCHTQKKMKAHDHFNI